MFPLGRTCAFSGADLAVVAPCLANGTAAGSLAEESAQTTGAASFLEDGVASLFPEICLGTRGTHVEDKDLEVNR